MVDILKICNIVNNSVKKFSGERKYLATGDLDRNKIISYNMVTYDNRPSRANQEVAEGNIIVARMKDTVKVLLIDKSCENVIVSTGFMVLKAKEGVYNNYLRILLESSLFQVQKDKLSKGATQQAINNENFKQIKLPLPHLDIQKKIADTLDKAQELIDKRKEQISALDKFLESLFLDMFGDPVSNPMGWEVKASRDLFYDLVGGHSLMGEARQLTDNEIAVLKISAVTSGRFKPNEYKVVFSDNLTRNLVFIKKGDLLFSRANTREMVGAVCIVNKDYPQLFLPDKLWRIDLKEECDKYYYKFLISHKKFKQNLANVATGTSGSMLNISKEKLRDLKIPLPPLDLQNKFSSIVEKVETEKTKLEASLTEMEDNFNSIMQRAFKGELF